VPKVSDKQAPPQSSAADPIQAEIQAVLLRAQKGDVSVLPRLREILDANPAIWQRYGDLGLHSQNAWIRHIAGPDLYLSEALSRKVGSLHKDLQSPSATPLERLLVERIGACWMQLHYADCAAAQARGIGIKEAAFAERRQDSANRRLVASIRALALVQRVLTPQPAKAAESEPADSTPKAIKAGRAAKPTAAKPSAVTSTGPADRPSDQDQRELGRRHSGRRSRRHRGWRRRRRRAVAAAT
jgi:hypothetical protein